MVVDRAFWTLLCHILRNIYLFSANFHHIHNSAFGRFVSVGALMSTSCVAPVCRPSLFPSPLPAAVCCSRSCPAGSWREKPSRERNRSGVGREVCACVWCVSECMCGSHGWKTVTIKRTLKLRRRGKDKQKT